MTITRKKLLALALCALGFSGAKAANYAWPANWEGVMLQGFYWDSYTDTKWTNLESQADELSKYFKLIWVPNSAYCGGHQNMGYMPIYWFTNHTSSFGTEAQLRSMIKTFKDKGTGIIADVVVNHRAGKSNWTDFPTEQWNGQTWSIGPEGICNTDEVRNAAGQAKPTGAADTGEDFDGARDLDHTNANVQNNVKNYAKCLLQEYGYAGFRYDMVKGYGGQYTKMYNEYSHPTYSVGEYWDGSYDAVARWIEATGKQSAAFDFPCKYAINEAFANNDMTKLVWMANGTTPQPAGMIHFGYSQYAVTFVDNHDTYRDGSKFTSGKVVAANAFILCSPGAPCVFLPHYKANKAAIQRLIDVRNSVGLHNNSAVKVLQTDRSCYMAEVTGSKGKLVVKIGDAMVSPAGYSDGDIVASGDGYCVWTKVSVSGGNQGGGNQGGNQGGDEPVGDAVTIYYDNSSTNWTTPYIHYWGGPESTWPGVAMNKVDGNIYKYDCPAGTTGCLFNAGDGDATKTSDFVAVHNHVYTKSGDQGVYQGGGNQGGGNQVTMPSQLYVLGNIEGAQWDTTSGIEMTKEGDTFVAKGVTLTPIEPTAEKCYFTFVTALGVDWDMVNGGGNRYGAPAKDTPLEVGGSAPMKEYVVDVNASAAESWEVPAGKYDITADFKTMTVRLALAGTNSVYEFEMDNLGASEYFNLQGMPVAVPEQGGIYIMVRGGKASKVVVR